MPPRVPDSQILLQLLREARPLWPKLALIFALSLLSIPIALLLPLPLQLVVDSVLGARPLPGALSGLVPSALARSPQALLALVAALLVVVSMLQHLEGFASWLLQSRTGEQLVLRARSRLLEHAQRLSLSHHDRAGTADALCRIHDDSVPAHYLVVSGLLPLVTSSCVLVGLLAVTAWIDWTLATIALVVIPALVLLTQRYRRTVRAGWAEVRELDSGAQAVLQETLGALRVVKAFGQEQRERERYLSRAREAMNSQLRVILHEASFGLLVAFTLALGTSLVLYIGVQHVRSGALTLGNLLLVMGYLAQLYRPIETISKKVTGLQSALASADRALALLSLPSEVPEAARPVPITRATGAIALRGVSFAYAGGPSVLRDATLEIPAGSRVGVSGQTGAGKTTLIGLLLRFFDPTAGSVLLDGIDVREYALADLRKQFALVLQEPVLFSTSIAENIAYGRPGASQHEIEQAARAANAHGFISALPNGYDTVLGERGMTLSGGERQRISLARAFLKDAPVLVLDEPTSAIDARNEQLIMEALDRLMRGRTALIIAHRLNTLADCDLRLEVEAGRIQTIAPSAATLHAKDGSFSPITHAEEA